MFLDAASEQKFYKQIDILNDEIDTSTAVIMFNNIGLNFCVGSPAKNYWEMKGVQVYDILVDHPVNYLDSIAIAFSNVNFITIDAGHQKFMQESFPFLHNQVFFLPHGGNNLGLMENKNRNIDILYLGACQENNQILPTIDFMEGEEQTFYQFCYSKYMDNLYIQVDDIVDLYMQQYNKQFSYEQRLSLIALLVMSIERKAMHDKKMKLMISLIDAGFHVEIHGENWELLQKEYPENIKLGEQLTPQECIERMGQAKITLNMQPYFTEGAHERVFNAMLNGSVCVSNRSRYLERRFQDGQDILYIDFQNINETVRKIKELLESQTLLNDMRKNAYEKVLQDTWNVRLEQILKHDYDESLREGNG